MNGWTHKLVDQLLTCTSISVIRLSNSGSEQRSNVSRGDSMLTGLQLFLLDLEIEEIRNPGYISDNAGLSLRYLSNHFLGVFL